MSTLLTGIGVGVAIAAPVGPIGLLCIRRSLAQGRVAGLATGLGAASADAVYGVLVAARLSMTGWLVDHARPMQIGGGMLIVLLGVMAFRAGFAPRARAAQLPGAGGIFGDWASTFVLTLSNPMTILSFTGLMAGLGAGIGAGGAWMLVLGVFLGSALWWLLLVHMALILRDWMTAERLRWLDFASGAVLIVWGAQIALSALV